MVSAAMVPTVSAAADGWRTSAGVTPGVMYTDNVCLEPENEQGEWIGLLTPDIAISREGSKASVSLAAAVEMNTLSNSKLQRLGCFRGEFANRKQYSPRLRGNLNTAVLEDFLFLDVGAYIDQNLVSPFLPGGDDSLNRLGNTNTSYRYDISPYIDSDLGEFANTYLRYTWDEERNSEDLVADSEQEVIDFQLSSLPVDALLSYGLEARYDRVEYDESLNQQATESTLRSAQVNLAIRFNPQWQLNGYYGEEDNDFFSVADEIDGEFWDVGLRWTPSERTEVEVGTGNRFFGDTPRASISHRHKRSLFEFSYRKDITYNRNIRRQDSLLPDTDVIGQPVDPSTGRPLEVNADATTQTTSPILDERYALTYQYQGRRSTFGINLSHSDQTRAEDGRDSVFRRAMISLDRQLGRSVTVFSALAWDEAEPSGDQGEFVLKAETWNAVFGLENRLSQKMTLNGSYRYTDRSSDRETNDYRENRLTITLRYELK